MGSFKNPKFSDIKRRAILDAAIEEFESKGPQKASMRAIAAKAGMTTGAIYTSFGGKEDLYAALLLESLERLRVFVDDKIASTDGKPEAVRAAVMAFFTYYRDRLFEVQLGMHSFEGFHQSSLGTERDEVLNSALVAVLDSIAGTIERAAPELSREEVISERNAIFSSLLGALSLAHTGRARSINTTPEAVMESHVQALLKRIKVD